MALPSALAPLCAIPNWVLWRRERRDDDDEGRERWTKPPYMARAPRRYASTADSATWAPYELAEEVAEREGLRGINGGTGFVLKDCAFSGVDLDKCINEDGSFCASVASVIRQARAAGCYIEISPSGMGLHIFGRSSSGPVHTKWGVGGGAVVEVFRNTRRFLTVTGKQIFEEDYCEGMGDIDGLIDALIKGRPEGRARATASASRANGAAAAAAGNGGGSSDGGGGADSTTSGLFHKKVCDLADRGLNTDEICATMRKNAKRYSDTKAGAYEAQGRLAQEVGRCFAKWEQKHGAQLEVGWSNGRLPKATCADARIAVGALGITCSHDEFHSRFFIEGEILGKKWNGELTDNVAAHLRHLIWDHYRFDPGKDNLHDALTQLCVDNSFNPTLEYLERVQRRDEKTRVGDWVVKYLGCEDTELNRIMGRKILIAHVRRVKQPGVKFDQIVTLEGPEGIWKSTAIEVLVGAENFSDQSILGLSDQKQQELLQGVWGFEIADLKGMKHAEVEAVKAFASRRVDRARPVWGRRRMDQPRTAVIWATTNEMHGGYLKSDTGNRRFWILRTGDIKINSLRRDRDQLWAEAVELERSGESLELPPELWGEAAEEQRKRQEVDPWIVLLADVRGTRYDVRADGLAGWEERIGSRTLLSAVLGLRPSDLGPGTWRRLAAVMRQLRWVRADDRIRISGRLEHGYYRRHNWIERT